MSLLFAIFFVLVCAIIYGLITLGNKKPAPEDEAETAIREQERAVQEFKRKLMMLRDHVQGLEKEKQKADAEVEDWKLRLDGAVARKDKDHAGLLLRNKMQFELKSQNYQHELDAFNSNVEQLDEQLRLAEAQIEQARSDKNILKVRLESAKIREQLADKKLSLGALEDKTIKHEATAQAYEETNPEQQAFARKHTVSDLDVSIELDRLMNEKK